MVIRGKRQRTVGAAAGGWVGIVSRVEQLRVLTVAGRCPARPAAAAHPAAHSASQSVQRACSCWQSSCFLSCPALLQYVGAVNTVFGRTGALWLGFFQYINLVFTCVACECTGGA